jgi:uncharacterized protein YggU (UPF0235/DUF167 family)
LSQDQTRITVRVQPNAKQNEVLAFEEGVLHISKSQVAIEKGETSRRKVIAIEGLSQNQILERLHGLRR